MDTKRVQIRYIWIWLNDIHIYGHGCFYLKYPWNYQSPSKQSCRNFIHCTMMVSYKWLRWGFLWNIRNITSLLSHFVCTLSTQPGYLFRNPRCLRLIRILLAKNIGMWGMKKILTISQHWFKYWLYQCRTDTKSLLENVYLCHKRLNT